MLLGWVCDDGWWGVCLGVFDGSVVLRLWFWLNQSKTVSLAICSTTMFALMLYKYYQNHFYQALCHQ